MNRTAVALATAGRVLRQLRHDHRTVGLILGVPVLLLTPPARSSASCRRR